MLRKYLGQLCVYFVTFLTLCDYVRGRSVCVGRSLFSWVSFCLFMHCLSMSKEGEIFEVSMWGGILIPIFWVSICLFMYCLSMSKEGEIFEVSMWGGILIPIFWVSLYFPAAKFVFRKGKFLCYPLVSQTICFLIFYVSVIIF